MGELERLKEIYSDDRTAADYHEQRFGKLPWSVQHEFEIEKANDFCKSIAPARLLDIATGPGRLVRALTGEKCFALDANISMLRTAMENSPQNWSFIKGDALNIPFSDKSF